MTTRPASAVPETGSDRPHAQHCRTQVIPLAEATRGGLVESTHFGSFAAVSAEGEVLASAGDVDGQFFARSTLKPIQLLAMLRSGLDLPTELLALAAASHSGSPAHIAGARRILSLHGLDESALRNTPDLPYGTAEREAFLRSGGAPSRLAQNCSGKHAAMVATCAINGWSQDDYLSPDHPLQRLIEATLAELTGEATGTVTTDGCGAPLFATSLTGTARAYATLVSESPGTSAARVSAAMRAHPEMVGGEGRDVTALMQTVPGLLAKDGAEAVQMLGLPRAGAGAIGIAVKIADGSDRARLPVTNRLLTAFGVPAENLAEISSPPILGGGEPVGELRARADLEGHLGEYSTTMSTMTTDSRPEPTN